MLMILFSLQLFSNRQQKELENRKPSVGFTIGIHYQWDAESKMALQPCFVSHVPHSLRSGDGHTGARALRSEPMVGDKRSAPDAPETSNDDGSQPERGKKAAG
jgi:hypothetical protein